MFYGVLEILGIVDVSIYIFLLVVCYVWEFIDLIDFNFLIDECRS